MSYGGPTSQEGLYSRSSPPSDGHDIIAHAPDPYYHDDEYDGSGRRRDTMGSDGSDGERYYDHNGQYDPYGTWMSRHSVLGVSGGRLTTFEQPRRTRTATLTCMARSRTHRRMGRSTARRGWG
jgi:hypothetical protein